MVMQRTATPLTPVRFRPAPPFSMVKGGPRMTHTARGSFGWSDGIICGVLAQFEAALGKSYKNSIYAGLSPTLRFANWSDSWVCERLCVRSVVNIFLLCFFPTQ